MASKYPDQSAASAVGVDTYRDGRGRDAVRRVTCDFVATGSGSFYSRSCSNLAAWVKVYRHDDGTVTRTNTLRCHRHRAIDERTATNRGASWSGLFPQFDPFDGLAEGKRLIREAQAQAEEKRLAEISAKVAQCVAYVSAHSVLDPDTRASLDAIHAMATLGTLVVR